VVRSERTSVDLFVRNDTGVSPQRRVQLGGADVDGINAGSTVLKQTVGKTSSARTDVGTYRTANIKLGHLQGRLEFEASARDVAKGFSLQSKLSLNRHASTRFVDSLVCNHHFTGQYQRLGLGSRLGQAFLDQEHIETFFAWRLHAVPTAIAPGVDKCTCGLSAPPGRRDKKVHNMWRWLLILMCGCSLLLTPLSGVDGGGPVGTGGSTGAVGGSGSGGTGATPATGGTGARDAGANDAGRDAGRPDAGAVDSGILFSESFDRAGLTLTQPRFTFDFTAAANTNATVDTTRGANGSTQSLRLDVGQGYDNRHIWFLPVPALTQGFLRFYIRVPNSSTINGAWVMAAASGSSMRTGIYNSLPFDSELRFGGDLNVYASGYETAGYYVQRGPHSNCWYRTMAQIVQNSAADNWTCVEYEFDAVGREGHAWVNGSPVTGLNPLTETPMGANCQGTETNSRWVFPNSFSRFTLGFVAYTMGTQRFSVWYDDVVFSTSRIGCR
jgi:hypothetical protein